MSNNKFYVNGIKDFNRIIMLKLEKLIKEYKLTLYNINQYLKKYKVKYNQDVQIIKKSFENQYFIKYYSILENLYNEFLKLFDDLNNTIAKSFPNITNDYYNYTNEKYKILLNKLEYLLYFYNNPKKFKSYLYDKQTILKIPEKKTIIKEKSYTCKKDPNNSESCTIKKFQEEQEQEQEEQEQEEQEEQEEKNNNRPLPFSIENKYDNIYSAAEQVKQEKEIKKSKSKPHNMMMMKNEQLFSNENNVMDMLNQIKNEIEKNKSLEKVQEKQIEQLEQIEDFNKQEDKNKFAKLTVEEVNKIKKNLKELYLNMEKITESIINIK